LTATAGEIPVFGQPGLDHLGFEVTAKRAFHRAAQLAVDQP